MKILISETAKNSLEEIVDFLKTNWTVKEVTILKNDIKNFRQTITDDIVKHPSLESFPNVKYTFIGKKQVKLIYEIKTDEIIIKLFWHCKQNPVKLKYLLNEEKLKNEV